MGSRKYSSATRKLIAETKERERDQVVSLLIRVSDPKSPQVEAVIRDCGGQVRTRAGDIISLTLPLRCLDDLAKVESVISIEVAEPLYPETRRTKTGE
jgi:hypothetical protein